MVWVIVKDSKFYSVYNLEHVCVQPYVEICLGANYYALSTNDQMALPKCGETI